MKGALGMFKAVFDLPNVTAIMIKDPEENMLRLEGVTSDGEGSFYAQNAYGGLWMLHARGEKKTSEPFESTSNRKQRSSPGIWS